MDGGMVMQNSSGVGFDQTAPQRAARQQTGDSPDGLDHPGFFMSMPATSEFKVIRRNGAVAEFEPAKIVVAMTKAFLAVNGSQAAVSASVRDVVTK